MYKSFLFYYGIPFYNAFLEKTDELYGRIMHIKNTFFALLNSERLVFFVGNPHAYIASYIHYDKSSIILWNYDRYKKLFYMYNCGIKDTKHIPLLSAKLMIDNEEIYNLDKFVDTIRINSSNYSYPTPNQILEAWAYTEGYVLDRRQPYVLEYLDTNLNDIKINPFTDDFIFNKIKRV